MLSVEQCGRVNEMLILKKKEIFVKNKEKKTREMAANVKLFADRTMSASQKKTTIKGIKLGEVENGIRLVTSL